MGHAQSIDHRRKFDSYDVCDRILALMSGIFAEITVIPAGLRKYYALAGWSCTISLVLGLIFIMGIVGIVIFHHIMKNKEDFYNQ